MEANTPSSGRGPVIRYLVVLAVGYVFGAKAGRRRYEQIAGTYKAVTESPAAKAVIDAVDAHRAKADSAKGMD